MRRKISANDPCSCGSGQKYKRCCRDKINNSVNHAERNHQAIWEAYADEILFGVEKGSEIKAIFFTLLEAINGLKWRGACHLASPMLCTLFRGIGLDASVCTGNVATENGIISHSWVEVDGKVYDVTIWLQKKNEMNNAPVIASINVDTGEKTDSLYGVDGLPLEPGVNDLFFKSFFWIMNSTVNAENTPYEMTVWELLVMIAYRLKSLYKIDIDMTELKEKLVDMNYTRIKKYPADSKLAGYSSSLIAGLIGGTWENEDVITKGNNIKLTFFEDGMCRFESGIESKSLYWHYTDNMIKLTPGEKLDEAVVLATLSNISVNAEAFWLRLKSDKWGLLYKSMDYI